MIFPKRSMQKPSFWATETIFNSCPAGVAKDQNPLKTQSISSLPACLGLSFHPRRFVAVSGMEITVPRHTRSQLGQRDAITVQIFPSVLRQKQFNQKQNHQNLTVESSYTVIQKLRVIESLRSTSSRVNHSILGS